MKRILSILIFLILFLFIFYSVLDDESNGPIKAYNISRFQKLSVVEVSKFEK